MNARSLRKKLARQLRYSRRAHLRVHVPRDGFVVPSPNWTPPEKWDGRGGLINGHWHDVNLVGSTFRTDYEFVLSEHAGYFDSFRVLVHTPEPRWAEGVELDRFAPPFIWAHPGVNQLRPEFRFNETAWRAKGVELAWAPNGGGVLLVSAGPRYLDQTAAAIRRLFKAAERLGIRLRLEA